MSTRSLKTTPAFQDFSYAWRQFALALVLGSLATVNSSFAQQKLSGLPASVAPIYWNKQKGVKKYRLQIAGDDRFNDVLFDGRITGEHYLVRDLPPGRYYWRIAPSDFQTREFHQPVAFEVPGTIKDADKPAGKLARNIPTSDSGWVAATGYIAAPIRASLRTASRDDFIGVNSEGTVYALDGSTGTALWTRRYGSNPLSKLAMPATRFRPLVLKALNERSIVPIVIVAYDGGLRALNGATGREVWRAPLPGNAIAGVVTEDISPESKAYLIVDNSRREQLLVVINGSSGRIEAETRLTGHINDNAIGPPVLFGDRNRPGVLVPLTGGIIAEYDRAGQLFRFLKTGADITSAPVIVETPRRELMLVGTKKGLAVFDVADFKLLQYFEIGDAPVHSLSVAAVDGNRVSEVVAIDDRDRVSLVDLDRMKTRWSADGASEASTVAFADVDGDGRLDVLLPGKDDFAIALSGITGSIIWKSQGQISKTAVGTKKRTRSLAVSQLYTGRLILVGNDASSGGLRGIEVTPTAVTSNVR